MTGCLGCLGVIEFPAPLFDGRVVCGACPELHDEREAANICRIGNRQMRADELLKIEIRRGKRAADRIRSKVAIFWPVRGLL